MSKPNMNCGECPYWLAYGEPETTYEQNLEIEAHCRECKCDELGGLVESVIRTPEKTGVAMKHLSELMDKHRAEHPELYVVDAATGENKGSVVIDPWNE